MLYSVQNLKNQHAIEDVYGRAEPKGYFYLTSSSISSNPTQDVENLTENEIKPDDEQQLLTSEDVKNVDIIKNNKRNDCKY